MDGGTNQAIVDAQVVDNTSSTADQNQAEVLVSLGELIKSHIQNLDRMRVELKEQKQMLEDGFINNTNFKTASDEAKTAAKKKAEIRHQIMQVPAVAAISQKIKSLSSEVKEKQMALSDYLLEYQRMAGVNEVEGYDGEVREIVNQARLVKKAARH